MRWECPLPYRITREPEEIVPITIKLFKTNFYLTQIPQSY